MTDLNCPSCGKLFDQLEEVSQICDTWSSGTYRVEGNKILVDPDGSRREDWVGHVLYNLVCVIGHTWRLPEDFKVDGGCW